MHTKSLPAMTFQLEPGQSLAYGRICKVRRHYHVHSTGKLLLSTVSALKPSSHDIVPESRELSHLSMLFAFWGQLGTVPSLAKSRRHKKEALNAYLSTHHSNSLFPAGLEASLLCQGLEALWLQIYSSPNTPHSKNRQ